jgi:hypothetical protein
MLTATSAMKKWIVDMKGYGDVGSGAEEREDAEKIRLLQR